MHMCMIFNNMMKSCDDVLQSIEITITDPTWTNKNEIKGVPLVMENRTAISIGVKYKPLPAGGRINTMWGTWLEDKNGVSLHLESSPEESSRYLIFDEHSVYCCSGWVRK